MSNEQAVTHIRVDGIRISLEFPPFFIFQDMKKGLAYYETYVKEAIKEGKPVRSPKSYLEEIIEQLQKHEYKLELTVVKVVETFGYEWGYSWAVFAYYSETKYFVRITDKKQESEIHPLTNTTAIMRRLLKGESLMLEPITFKEYE